MASAAFVVLFVAANTHPAFATSFDAPENVTTMSTFPFHGYRCRAVTDVATGSAASRLTAASAAANRQEIFTAYFPSGKYFLVLVW